MKTKRNRDDRFEDLSLKITEIIGILLIVVAAGAAYSRLANTWLISNGELARLDQLSLQWGLSLLGGLIQTLLFIFLVYYVVAIRHRSRLRAIGLQKAGWSVSQLLGQGIWGGLFLVMTVMLVSVILTLIFKFPNSPQPFAELLNRSSSLWQLMVLMLIGSVLAPISEELYFRGMVYSYLGKHFNSWFAILGSSAIFAGMHLDLYRFFPLFLGGIGLAYLYQRSRSLYVPILAHSVWNTVMTLLLWWGKEMVA